MKRNNMKPSAFRNVALLAMFSFEISTVATAFAASPSNRMTISNMPLVVRDFGRPKTTHIRQKNLSALSMHPGSMWSSMLLRGGADVASSSVDAATAAGAAAADAATAAAGAATAAAGAATAAATAAGAAATTADSVGRISPLVKLLGIGTATPQALFNSIFASLAMLTVLAKVVQRVTNETSKDAAEKKRSKPAFVKSLQSRFLAVFWLLRCSDWLQGPYFYEVYASKLVNGAPASMALVSRLFLTGFASTALFGPAVGKAADQYGRKRATLAFTLIYAAGALSTKSTLLQFLFLGRVLSGIGTSLLFSAPESWLVGAASKKDGENGEDAMDYLGETFGLAYAGDSIVAIAAGQMAGAAATARGPTGPFELSTLFLGLGGILSALLWKENKAEKTKAEEPQLGVVAKKKKSSISEAVDICIKDPKIMMVGAVQSLFEAAMYIFVLQWPPAMAKVIDKVFVNSVDVATPYGTIFSCFMACCLLGSTLFGQFAKMAVPTEKFTSGMLAMATLAMSTSTWIVQQPNSALSLPVLTAAFFVFEAAVGMYFPSIGTLRSRFVPDSHRSIIMNLFGIPLNVLVVSVFLSIHKLGVGGALTISSGALGIATLCMLRLQSLVSKSKTDIDVDVDVNASVDTNADVDDEPDIDATAQPAAA